MGTAHTKSHEREDLVGNNGADLQMTPNVEFSGTNSDTQKMGDRNVGEGEDNTDVEDKKNINIEREYGTIKFRGITRETKAKFIVLEHKESASDVWKKMSKLWDIDEPRLIISVIGGARPFNLDDRIEASFKATITKLSKLPDACIITGGGYSGVMKLVGDAHQESSSSFCLGISTWNDIEDIKKIVSNDGKPYVVGSWLNHLYLDYQHTNFLIVKEKENSVNGQIVFRASLESYLKKLSSKPPCILVVVNGGFGTIDSVKEYISQVNEKDNETETYVQSRIVLVDKSGKCADLLSSASRTWINDEEGIEVKYGLKYYELFQDMVNCLVTWIASDERQRAVKKWWEEVKSRLLNKDSVVVDPDNDTEQLYMTLKNGFESLLYCLKSKDIFIVAGLNSGVDIDTAVLNGLLTGHANDFDKMELTLLYDRADYAKSEIFSHDPEVEDEKLWTLMIMALQRGDHEYVKLLMDYGVNMHQLNAEALEKLYGYQLFEDNFLLRKFIKEHLGEDWEKYKERNLLKNQMERNRLPYQYIRKLINHLTTRFVENKVLIFNCNLPADETLQYEQDDTRPYDQEKFEDPFWELFLWAVICNMPAMADFLWPFGRDQLAKALVGAEVFDQLSREDATYQQATLSLRQCSRNYLAVAQELLDELSATNEENSRKLVTTVLNHIPTMTCIDIAVKTNHHEFVAHSSIQMILWDVWTGYTKTKKLRPMDYVKFLISIVFPFYIVAYGNEDAKANIKSHFICSTSKQSELRSLKSVGTEDHNSCKVHDHLAEMEDYSLRKKIKQFYFATPIVTFILHMFGATVFLGIYSYVVVSGQVIRPDYSAGKISPFEAYLFLYMIGYVVGEVYQIVQYDGGFRTKLWYWVVDGKNMFDMFNCLLYFLAFTLSFYQRTQDFSHTLYSINCGLWIIRFSIVVRVFSKLGLYFEMITTMLVDLLWFLVILGVFILAFGVTSTSLLYPGVKDPIKHLHMFLRSWFSIYGEYFMEIQLDGNSTTHLTTPRRNPYDEYVVIIIMGLYLLLTNILLMNIIIAAFNTTYANIQVKARHISRYRLYDLVLEYSRRVSTPPPLSLLHHAYKCIRWLIRKCCGTDTPPHSFMAKLRQKRHNNKKSGKDGKRGCSCEEKLRDFEYYCAVKVVKQETKGAAITDYLEDSQTQQVVKRIDTLQEKLSTAIERSDGVRGSSPQLTRSSSKGLEGVISSEQFLQQEESLNGELIKHFKSLEDQVADCIKEQEKNRLASDATQQIMLASIKAMEAAIQKMNANMSQET